MAQYNPFGQPGQQPQMRNLMQPQQSADPAMQAKPIAGRQWGNGVGQKASDDSIGQLYKGQILDDMWNTGQTGSAARQLGQVEALKGAMSQANPADIAAQTQMRDYYTNALGGLGNLGDMRGTALDTQMQRGMGNLLQTYKNQHAGSGLGNSSQFGRGQGDIASRMSEEYTKGLNDLSGQQLQNAGMIQNGLGNLLNQDVNERNLQFNQAQGYSNLLGSQIGQDQARQGQLAGNQKSDWLSDAAPLIGAGAGLAISGGNPMGAMAGGQIGGMLGGQKGGGQSGGQTGASMGQLYAMNQGGGQMQQQQPWYANGGTPVSNGLQNQFNSVQQMPYSGYNSGYAPGFSAGQGMGISPYKFQ